MSKNWTLELPRMIWPYAIFSPGGELAQRRWRKAPAGAVETPNQVARLYVTIGVSIRPTSNRGVV